MAKLAAWTLSVATLLLMHPGCGSAQQPKKPAPLSAGVSVPGAPAVVLPGKPDLPRIPPESERAECDEPARLDAKGRPVFPAGATAIEPAVDVDEDRGQLSALYPALDTTTDAFYPLPCDPSIGGTLPAAVNDPPTQQELDAENYLQEFEDKTSEDILKQSRLGTIEELRLPQIEAFNAGDCLIKVQITPTVSEYKKISCDDRQLLASDQPFEGRDIIYVHGLNTGHFEGWIANDPSARTPWLGPQDPGASQYLDSGGYFRQSARSYWSDHIHEHLINPANPFSATAGWEWLPGQPQAVYRPKANRYLVVAWSSNQTMVYAQHALLSQIQLAITTNKNVVTPPTYPTNVVRPFCWNGCIVIGHSTGPLITDTAMSLARFGFFGPGARQIPDRIHAHVSFAGATSGSRLATIGMAVGLAVGPAPLLICDIAVQVLHLPCQGFDLSFVGHTILRDLIPFVAQGIWGFWVATTPVPTVMVAGGHSFGFAVSAGRFLLPGLDDGVVTMNSACGNPNPVFPRVLAPSGAVVASYLKAFDYSGNPAKLQRAVKNFISHTNLKGPFGIPPPPLFLAAGCTPWRTPTGMVMPILFPGIGGPWDARNRYPNHFSFIQASLSHLYDGQGEDPQNPWPSTPSQAATVGRHYLPSSTANVEETSAITNSAIYAAASDGTHLVMPSFAGEMHEIVRGRSISFRIPIRTRRCPNKRCTVWIWKRTYHLLEPSKFKQSSHYVYEFVARR
jgi:hypothetical protein